MSVTWYKIKIETFIDRERKQELALKSDSIDITHPHLISEWSSKNTIQPSDVSFGSDKKVLWECFLGHEWTVSISNRARLGTRCPYCAGNKAWSGFNDLESINPAMAKFWSKNNRLKPDQILPRAKAKHLWICELGHEWDESPHAFSSRDKTCPICVGRRVLEGFNDLRTTDQYLESSWSINNKLKMTEVSRGSDRKALWICELKHEWEARISSRLTVNGKTGNGCPYCAGLAVLIGFNDLGTLRPEIATQWSVKNRMKPNEVVTGTKQKFYWDCKLGHDWEASVIDRTGKNSGCSICAGKKVLAGFNDFASLGDPEIVKEWSLNNALKPNEVTLASKHKVEWNCQAFGHSWVTNVGHRTVSGTGCPECSTSKNEKAFVASFSKHSGFDFASANIPLVRDLYINKRAQIDGLCEDLMVAVEYDGQWSHGHTVMHGKQGDGAHRALRDAATTEALLNAGYRVIRIREHDAKAKLPFVIVDPANLHTSELVNNLHQVTYKSNGKHKDDIDTIVKKIVADKGEWFVNGRTT